MDSYQLVITGICEPTAEIADQVLDLIEDVMPDEVLDRTTLITLNQPLVVKSSDSEAQLTALYDSISRAGGKVQIIRSRSTDQFPEEAPPRRYPPVVEESTSTKVKTLEELQTLVARHRSAGRKIVLCHGVFDLVHLGHVRHINAARKHGDILIITITADQHVKRGPGRPVFNHNLRAETLSNLEAVDYVAIIDAPTAMASIEAIQPDVYVKGQDYKDKKKDLTGKIFDEQEAVERYGGKVVFTDEITFSSSQLINLYLDSYPPQTMEYLKEISSRYSIERIAEMLDALKQMRILVIGDAIIDQYHYCTTLGKSSKENIVANKYLSEENFAGGSLAVANHVAQLSDNVTLLTVLGENDSFRDFIQAKLNSKIKAEFVPRPGCVTTVKRRYIAGDTNKKLFEVCFLEDTPLPRREEQLVGNFLEQYLKDYDLVLAADFGHGMITRRLMGMLSRPTNRLALNVQSNSANRGFNLVTKYARGDFICIDEAEIRLATHSRFGDIPKLARQICHRLHARQIIVTQGSEGSLSYVQGQGFSKTPALGFQKVDLVGAGDAFYALTSPCFAAGYPQDLIGLIGNAVGSLAIQIVCNREPVNKTDLLKFLTRLLKF
ncbi:MAG: adenylyltransferase/cytidyltransferase family protein [Oligoflexia bacterium]|nr:adenylyltransferase/cytidyltransferase family protein [Oligoflexia bacterium]